MWCRKQLASLETLSFPWRKTRQAQKGQHMIPFISLCTQVLQTHGNATICLSAQFKNALQSGVVRGELFFFHGKWLSQHHVILQHFLCNVGFPPSTPSAKFLKRVSGRHLQKIRHLHPIPFPSLEETNYSKLKTHEQVAVGVPIVLSSAMAVSALCISALTSDLFYSLIRCFEINQQHLVIFLSLLFSHRGLCLVPSIWVEGRLHHHSVLPCFTKSSVWCRTAARLPPPLQIHLQGNCHTGWETNLWLDETEMWEFTPRRSHIHCRVLQTQLQPLCSGWWVVRFKLLLFPTPLPYPHQLAADKMVQKDRADSVCCIQCTNMVPLKGSVRAPQSPAASWLAVMDSFPRAWQMSGAKEELF